MKKLLFTLSLMLFVASSVFGNEVQINGLWYNLSGKTAEVIKYKYYNRYSGDIVIPQSVTYNNTDYSVTSIGKGAFGNCPDMTSITIPNSVTNIGQYIFSDCTSLYSIIVETGNKKYDSRENCNGIIETASNTLVAGCKYTNILNSVTTIGNSAFFGCTNLVSITIPNSVRNIEENAFYGCTGLTSITIPSSVTKIATSAFSGCSNLADFFVDEGNSIYKSEDGVLMSKDGTSLLLYPVKKSATVYNIPQNVKTICNAAFWGCKSLELITIPNSVTSIENYAFGECGRLSSITIPNSVTTIGEGSFEGCGSLTSITIPNSVASIGESAFSSCRNLESVLIPNSVISIGNNVFYSCCNMTTIVVEEGNTMYDSRNNCNAIIETSSNKLLVGCLKTTIPGNVSSIGEWAFGECSYLTSFTIPNSVKSIEKNAFYGCNRLTDVYCYAEDAPITETNAFPDIIKNVILHVPASSIEAYKVAEPWKKFRVIIPLTDNDPKPTSIKTTAVQEYEKNNIYDLKGHKKTQPSKGIFIKQGKKYITK